MGQADRPFGRSVMRSHSCSVFESGAAGGRRPFERRRTLSQQNLHGNTQVAQSSRQITKSVDPRNHAAWPLKELHRRLSEYAYEIYDTIHHPALGQSPREAFNAAIAHTGTRSHRQINYDRDFFFLTLPTTRKGTAKITAGRGMRVNNLYYWSEHFRNPTWETRQVSVRYDPFDVGTAYAFVDGQ